MPIQLIDIKPNQTTTSTSIGWTEQNDAYDYHDLADPAESNLTRAGNSIPSPFARMYLFDTAFEVVNKSRNYSPKESNIYHRLISQCFDVLELLYMYNTYIQAGKPLSIVRYDCDTEFSGLENSQNRGHQLLGRTLKMFKGADITNFYLILYKNPQTNADEVIAASSPYSLFFTAADIDAKTYIDIKTPSGHKLFSEVKHLSDRSEEFKQYIKRLFMVSPVLMASRIGEVGYNIKQYVNEVLTKQYDIQYDIAAFYAQTEYSNLTFGVGNDSLNVAGLTWRVKNVASGGNEMTNSSFIINTTKLINGKTPLVLKDGLQDINMNYTNTIQITKLAVDYYGGNKPVAARVLPDIGIAYPYFTYGDVFEDFLLKVPYPINSERFCTAKQVEGADDSQYLLPIRKEYLQLFKATEIEKQVTFKVQPDKSVVVEVAVPLKNRAAFPLTLSKKYSVDNPSDMKFGKIIEANFTVFVMPLFRFMPNSGLTHYNDYYKLLLVDNDLNKAGNYQLKFYKDGEDMNMIDVLHPSPRITKDAARGIPASIYYEISSPNLMADIQNGSTKDCSFDYIEVKYPQPERRGINDNNLQEVRALIIPKWVEKQQAGHKTFHAAIDFGTSNTFVALKENSATKADSFSIGESDMQMACFIKPSENSSTVAEKYKLYKNRENLLFGKLAPFFQEQERGFMPVIIGKNNGSIFDYPIRTVVCEDEQFENQPTKLWQNINIGFTVQAEKGVVNGLKFQTNIKWLLGKGNVNKKAKAAERLEVFFRQSLLLLRNKIVLNEGNIANTNLVWFAPLSLDIPAKNNFSKIWKKVFEQVFKVVTTNNLYFITESLAPYYYLTHPNHQQVIPGLGNIVNIDIGGGTTDALFFRNDNGKMTPEYSTSFQFAGNSIWGEGFGTGKRKDNGFLKMLYPAAKDKPVNANQEDYKIFLNTAMTREEFDSADVMGSLFAYDSTFGISEMLENDTELKFLLCLHYAATMYHLAQFINHNNIDIPRYLIFTGNGSTYIKILCSNNIEELQKFTNAIFKKVCKPEKVEAWNKNIRITLTDEPKKATAIGGLYGIGKAHDISEVQEKKYVGVLETTAVNHDELTLGEINQASFRNSVLENVKNLVDLLTTDKELISLMQNSFGITIDLRYIRQQLNQELLADGLQLGLNDLMNSYTDNAGKLDMSQFTNETLFFYPLRHVIYEMSKKIAKDKLGIQ
jgi:hypothetical protein